jgi:ABC-type multidrug transport system fused ATPase/permease subunit
MSYIMDEVFKPFVWSYKFTFILYTIGVIISHAIYTILIPLSLSEFMNSPMIQKQKGFMNIIKGVSMLKWLYVTIGLYISYLIISFGKGHIEHNMCVNFSGFSRSKIIEYIFYKLAKNYEEIQENEIIYTSTNIFASMRPLVRYLFESAIPMIITFILVAIYLGSVSTTLASYFVSFNVLMVIVGICYSNKIINKWHNTEYLWQNKCTNILGDKFKNLMNILFDNTLQKELGLLQKLQDNFTASMKNAFFMSTNLTIILKAILYLLFAVLLKSSMRFNKKTMSTVILMMIIYIGVFDTFIQDTDNSFRHMSNILDIHNNISNLDHTKECKPTEPFYEIIFDNVSFRYNSSTPYIIKNVSLTFKPKKINVIMGKSGSGKTTIMKLLIKMHEPSKGIIYMDGQNSKDICQKDIRDNIYYVNQRTILFDESVLYNFQYGNDVKKENIVNMLQKYDLLSMFDTLSKGLDTDSGVNGSNLSLGMQKVLMVMRGILKPHKSIVIFDEPLTSLDKNTRKKIVKLITEETKGKTLIIISHDPEILPHSDNTIQLN